MELPKQSLMMEIAFWSEMIAKEKDWQQPMIIKRMERARALAMNKLLKHEMTDYLNFGTENEGIQH